MKKLLMFCLLFLITIFMSSTAYTMSWGYGLNMSAINLWETVIPQNPLGPEDLKAGEYRLNLNAGKFGFKNEGWDSYYEEDWEEEYNAHNFFLGLDTALSDNWYLSCGYNVIPEFTWHESENRRDTAKGELLNIRLTHFLSEDISLYGGYARLSDQYKYYYQEELDDHYTNTINYLYLGAEVYGSFLK